MFDFHVGPVAIPSTSLVAELWGGDNVVVPVGSYIIVIPVLPDTFKIRFCLTFTGFKLLGLFSVGAFSENLVIQKTKPVLGANLLKSGQGWDFYKT